jgi:hypothetical protein
MSFALAGLILLQAYWIYDDIKLKEQQFDQSVMLALNDIVAKVEQQENIKIVVQNFISQNDSTGSGSSKNDSLLNYLGSIFGSNNVNINAANNDFSIIAQEIRKKVNEIKSNRKYNKDFNSNIFLDSSIDIRIENDIQQKEVISFNLNDESLIMDSIEREAERRMESKFNKLNTLMNKLTFQINDRNKSLLERIPPKVLDSIITKEFAGRNIPVNYIYGIKHVNKNNFEYTHPKSDTTKTEETVLRIVVSFIIEKDGTVSDIKIDRGNKETEQYENSIIQCFKKMPKWSPAYQDGKPIRILGREKITIIN